MNNALPETFYSSYNELNKDRKQRYTFMLFDYHCGKIMIPEYQIFPLFKL